MKCPQCYKEIPQDAAQCVCGYYFGATIVASDPFPVEGAATVVDQDISPIDTTLDSTEQEFLSQESQDSTFVENKNIFSSQELQDATAATISDLYNQEEQNSLTIQETDATALTFDQSGSRNLESFISTEPKDFTVQNIGKEKHLSLGANSQAMTTPRKPSAVDSFSPGSVIKDTYKILKVLGQGGMGKVYLANHLRLNKTVVIKTLLTQSGNETSLKRFQREALLQAQVTHPNAVSIIDLDQTIQGVLYMVMDYAPGKPLSELIQLNSIGFTDVIQIGKQIMDVLIHAHEKKIIHRDLKPQNIIVDGEKGKYYIKILDFGIAKMLSEKKQEISENLTGENRIVGTLRYMPPEQAVGEKVDFTADIYSAGVILYEMTTGSVPFSSNESLYSLTSMLINKKPPSFDEIKPRFSVPKSLEKAIMKALSKNPMDRFRNAEEFKKELEKIGMDIPKAGSSHGKVYAMIAAAFLLAFVSAFLYKGHLDKKEAAKKEKESYEISQKQLERQEAEKKELAKKELERQEAEKKALIKIENYKKMLQEIETFSQKGDWENALIITKKGLEVAENKEQQELLALQKKIENSIAKKIFLSAQSLQQKNLLDIAFKEYQRVLSYDKNFSEAHYYSGEILYWQGQYDKATEYFITAVQLEPNFALAFNKLGDIALKQGDLEKSLAYFQKALEIKPLAEAYSGIGVVYAQKGNYEQALEYIKKAQTLKPDLIEATQNLAIVLKNMERYEEALTIYESLKEKEPENPDIYYNMGSLYLKIKDYDNALKNLESYLLYEKSEQEKERIEKIQKIVKQLKARKKNK